MDAQSEAAAFWGGAENAVYPIEQRLAMALKALDYFGGLVGNADTPAPHRGADTQACDECKRQFHEWFTDHPLWNRIASGTEGQTDDPGGILCPNCFTTLANQLYPGTLWRLTPAWRPPHPRLANPGGRNP